MYYLQGYRICRPPIERLWRLEEGSSKGISFTFSPPLPPHPAASKHWEEQGFWRKQSQRPLLLYQCLHLGWMLCLLSLFSPIIWIKRQLSNVNLHNQVRKPKRSAICQNISKKESSQLLFHQVTAITCPHSLHLCFVDWAPRHLHASHMQHYHTKWFLNYCNYHA